MKLAEILEHPDFSYLKVLNRGADLSREVDTVESTETPDVANYLPQNTFLITTAMTFKDDQPGLCTYIEGLNRLPCAALAIKLGRFVDALDPMVIDTADALGLPLIQIPADKTLGSVFQQILAFLWQDQSTELNLVLNTQKKFSTLLLQGASVKAMLNNLSYVLKQPVALMNPFGNLVDTSHTVGEAERLAAEACFLDHKLYEGKERMTAAESGGVTLSAYPVGNMMGRCLYHLFIFHGRAKSPASALVVEHVLTVFGFSQYRRLYVIANTLRSRREFLEVLISRKNRDLYSGRQLLALGEKYGLVDKEQYRIVLGTLSLRGEGEFNFDNFTSREERYILIYAWMSARLKARFGKEVLLFGMAESFRFVLLVQGEPELEEELTEIHRAVSTFIKEEIAFSFGNGSADLSGLCYSYNEALETLAEGEALPRAPFIKHHRPKDARELLKALPVDQVERFCVYHLKALAYPDDETAAELRKTLATYLDCHCSMTEAANILFLHRNTIKYRIKKCESILDRRIEGARDHFDLELSLKLSD